ncbi:ABC transporter ATP-binding protein [Neobacillus niacini]|jgi:ABC-2 type transport system ATP-binding protein|uniref:ABC transporter ATP-binding protein n=1 Tax=Neobacillus niacini TaxID=86668 RepID=UPI001C8EB80A|nr:ABC transporter ATP-binding protein [Neobacillus niacini]MBY0149150.1 ABC transporter ATP-binding protein [Neobacillus niacini]
MQTLLVEVEGLTKKYKKFTLGPLHFQVERGVVIGLVGENGSGKSTLFRLLMNLLKEDDGHILMFGQKITEDDWKQKIGYAGELLEAYDFLTIMEMKKLISRWYQDWDEEMFVNLVKRYKIDISQKFSKCSKGTKKKVEFIFALCHHPELLLLDEPTAGVDLVSQRKMKEDMIHFMDDGEKSIVLATHTVDEINQLCDEIIVLDGGRIVHTYNKDEIYDHWARVWVSDVTEPIRQHPNVIYYNTIPLQIVTDNLEILEVALEKEQININQVQRLSMEEVLEYLIEGNES